MRSLLILLLSFSGVTWGQDAYVVRASRAHLGDGRVVAPAVVLVMHGKITAIGTELEIPEGTRVIDLGAGELLPGFVDCFSYHGLPRGDSENEEGSEVTPRTRVSDAFDVKSKAIETLAASGVTTLGSGPGSRAVVAGTSCAFKLRGTDRLSDVIAGDVALRINLGSAPCAGNVQVRWNAPRLYGRRPNSRMGVVYLVREAFAKARTLRERKSTRASLEANPELESFVAALEGRVTVHWVAPTAKDVRAMLEIVREFGVPKNVVLDGRGAHEVAEELAAAHIPVALGPLTVWPTLRGRGSRDPESCVEEGHEGHDHAHTQDAPEGAPEPLNPDAPCRHGRLFVESCSLCLQGGCCDAQGASESAWKDPEPDPAVRVGTLLDAGVHVALSSGGLEPGDQLLDFARFVARRGVTAERALTLVTSAPAQILGLADRIGSLKAGFQADLVAFDGDPLAPTSRVLWVMIDGKLVFDVAASLPRSN